MKGELQVGFVGNPNCGKTTLFNAYTGANLKVANWPGVTVEKKGRCLQILGIGNWWICRVLTVLPPIRGGAA
jgi:ribosome-interacting GTPase 1